MSLSNEQLRRLSRIHPSILDASIAAKIEAVKFHYITGKFVNAGELEELYQKKFVAEYLDRSFNICTVFLILYFMFTASNFSNLFSDDEEVRKESQNYCLMVYPVLAPAPFLLWASKRKKFHRHYQLIYSILITCWSFSFLAGGMHSMLKEWYKWVEDDMVKLLDFLKYPVDGNEIFTLSADDPDCNCTWWMHEDFTGTRRSMLFHFLGDVLLPAATMNINLLRLTMVFIVSPLLKIDTVHYGFVVGIISFSYCVLTMMFYPITDSPVFIMNRTLVICFALTISAAMLLRNRDYERIVRLDFLHVWSVEQAAAIANRQRELIADENKQLKKELDIQRGGTIIDLDSPLAKILQDLKLLQNDATIGDDNQDRISDILHALSRLDSNLFTPDINAQMSTTHDVDNDTKNWAMAVLGHNKYTRKQVRYASQRLHSGNSIKGEESTTMLPDVTPINDTLLRDIMYEMKHYGWDLDILSISQKTDNKPLYYVTTAAFEKSSLFEKLSISRTTFSNFMFEIDSGYINNPYHNSAHAADVTNAVNYLITAMAGGKILKSLTLQEYFAALIASAIHDFRHPGKSNLYMIKSQDDIAVQFSDSSVLERMHLAESFFLAKNESCNIFSGLKDKHYRDVRKAIIEMVLSTDLSIHLQLVGNLKTAKYSDSKDDVANDPMMIMKVVIKCADIGHAAKIRHLHGKWSSMIIEEFFLQGDSEREMGESISPFMDRKNENSAKNQVGFFEFIVLPFYEIVADVMLPVDFQPILQNVRENYKLWKYAVSEEMTAIEDISSKIFMNTNN